jgi:tetratricopeptide (TPR) repeat protein
MEGKNEVFETAIEDCRETVRAHPENAEAHHALGDILKKSGDLEGAMAEFREVIRLQPGGLSGHYQLGVALGEKGDVDGAIIEYREALKLEPGDSTAHYFIGQAFVMKGDLEEAIKEYQTGCRLEPDDNSLHFALGCALEKKGDLEGAIKEYREALRLEANDLAAQMCLSCALGLKGDVLAKQRNWKGAIDQYREAERLNPEMSNAHELLRDSIEDVCKNLGNGGDTESVARIYRAALAADGENDALHATLASLFSRQKKWEAAIKEYRLAIKLKPECDDWHLELGDTLAMQRNWQEAFIEYCEADRLGSYIDAHMHLDEVVGECCDELVKAHNLKRAISECRSALVADPQNADLHCKLGNLLAQNGELEKALTEYCEANRLEPKIDAHRKFYLAALERYGHGDWKRRLSGFMAASRVDPENGNLATELEIAQITLAGEQYEKGRGLAIEGDLTGAIRRYREALDVRNDFDQARLSLSVALLRNGDPIGALWEFIEHVGKTPLRRLLVQYMLLLAATTILAWSLGLIHSKNLERIFPRLAAFPLAIMFFAFCYKRFFRPVQ